MCLTLFLVGVFENKDTIPKSHVWCQNMTNDTSFESSYALFCKNCNFRWKIQLCSKNVCKKCQLTICSGTFSIIIFSINQCIESINSFSSLNWIFFSLWTCSQISSNVVFSIKNSSKSTEKFVNNETLQKPKTE